MQVTIKFNDSESLTVEEIVKQCEHNYGKSARVEIMPDSTKAHDLIYFGIQNIITHQQLSLFYDDKFGYIKSLQVLRNETLVKLGELLDQVIIDNESKITN